MAISSFNEDIYTEILLRLPVKSVLNFKTVSKQWLSISSSPRFRQNHASRHRSPARWLLFTEDSNCNGLLEFLPPGQINPRLLSREIREDLNLTDQYDYCTFTCKSSCNGLLLLRSSAYGSSDDEIIYAYYVYNPTTSECKVLNIPILMRDDVYASLAFDPSQSPHYKVVVLYPIYNVSTNSMKCEIEVYSSMTGICKDIICKEPITFIDKGFVPYCENGIYSNGRIHWLSSMASIFYFDVHTECINKLPTPWFMDSKVYYFGESSGHLQFVQSKYHYSETDEANLLDVYEMNKDYSGWFLKYQVDLSSIASQFDVGGGNNFGNIHEYCYVLSIFQNEGDETDESIMVILVYQDLVEYNLKTKTTKWLCRNMVPKSYARPHDRPDRHYKINNYQFIPTLACVYLLSEHSVKTTSADISRLPPGFQNLTRLELSGYGCVDLCAVINYILESMDNLEHLVVKGWSCGKPHQSCWSEPLNVPTCMLSGVTTICFTIYGDCCDQLLELLRYFLKNAKVLQLLTISFDFITVWKEVELLKKISMFPRGSPICQVAFTVDRAF